MNSRPINQYFSDGFSRGSICLSESDLSDINIWLKSAESAALSDPDAASSGRVVFDPVPHESGKRDIFILGDLCRYEKSFFNFLNNVDLRDIIQSCLGVKLPLIVHLINATIINPFRNRAINWHRDFPNGYICGAEANFLRIMICLDGMIEHRGATRFIPGSHLVSDAAAIAEKQRRLKHNYPSHAGVAAECGAGEVVLIHPKVIHGTPSSSGETARRNIIIQVGVDDGTLSGPREAITGSKFIESTPPHGDGALTGTSRPQS
jgi:hypothetical protein